MTVDATPPLIALPGTLLDDRSLGAMLALAAPQSGPVRIVVLGDCASLGDELARLALLTSQPAVWLGHSLGGIVALHLALHYPAKVAGLVLLGANARAGSDSSEPRRASQWALAQQQGLSALARSKLAPTYGLETGVDGRVEGNQALLDFLSR